MNNSLEILDHVRLNFSPAGLFFLNIALAFVMFGVALDIKVDHFTNLIKKPKSAIIGFTSQTFLLPAFTFLLVILINPLEIDNYQMFETVFILLGIPVVTGLFISRKFPLFTEKIKKPINKGSLIFFILMVVSMLAANFSQFMAYIHLVFFFVLLQNGIAMMTGYFFSSLFKCSQQDRRTIAIETGIHNSGLALALLFNPKISLLKWN
ncbi:MAG: hypothetical protein M0Q53_01915 [Prolixibacteraceae bacterium]|jgi:predicted Na+-dependent transporter|nr:hypothetical protein [Prolixibacteraceae bacterium]